MMQNYTYWIADVTNRLCQLLICDTWCVEINILTFEYFKKHPESHNCSWSSLTRLFVLFASNMYSKIVLWIQLMATYFILRNKTNITTQFESHCLFVFGLYWTTCTAANSEIISLSTPHWPHYKSQNLVSEQIYGTQWWQSDDMWSALTSRGTGRRLVRNPAAAERDTSPLAELSPKEIWYMKYDQIRLGQVWKRLFFHDWRINLFR